MSARRRPHLPISPCQPHSSGRSCSTGCSPTRTTASSRPGWLTRCVSLTPAFWQPRPGRTARPVGEDAPVTLREVTLLGSTGSIGRQAIEVAQRFPDRLAVTGLAAGGGDVGLLAEQALSLGVRTVAVARATAAQDLQLAFYAAASKRGWSRGEYALPEILAGPRAAEELAARPADVVLNGITGAIGLRPTLAPLRD